MVARTKLRTSRTSKGMGISSRLVALLAIPLAAVLVLAGIGVFSGMSSALEASRLEARTDLGLATYRVIDALQAERATLIADKTTSPEMRDAVTNSLAALKAEAEALGDETLTRRVDNATRQATALAGLTRNGMGGQIALKAYSRVIRDLLDTATIAIDPQGAISAAPSATLDYLARAQVAAAEERDLVAVLSEGRPVTAQDLQEIMRLASEQQSYVELAAASAPVVTGTAIRQVGFALSAADTARRAAVDGAELASIDGWTESLDARAAELATFQDQAEARAVAAVDALASSARTLLIVAVAVALVIVVLTIVLLRWAKRSIARPLQQLAADAEQVAQVRLPEAVRAQQDLDGATVELPALHAAGAAEVDEVAAAFNHVQETALALAGEQAALRVNQGEALTNLGRRNQTLLGRQLDFISTLERSETDPVFLDHLFKLDHLASRMRRNAESLLILAGSETPRRRRKPAEVTEVVRSAMSEVEDFDRVRIGHLLNATLAGPAVIDLVHLLAELIENALAFSPPDTTVEIDGRSMGHGGYQFAVIDHGVGMADRELVAANQRLSGEDEINGMPTKYLGQYVVAKLATKLGATVRLQLSSGGRGVTALVMVPATSVLGGARSASAAAPRPGTAAARAAGPAPFAPGLHDAPSVGVEIDPEYLVAEAVPTQVWDAPIAAGPGVDPPNDAVPFVGMSSIDVPGVDVESLDGSLVKRPYPWPPPDPAKPSVFAQGVDVWSRFMADEVESAPPVSPFTERSERGDQSLPSVPSAPAPAVPAIDAPAAAAGPSGTARTGGLARRVPGKTLNDRNGEMPATAGGGDVRSADGVRSMLASLQDGRSRGRSGAGTSVVEDLTDDRFDNRFEDHSDNGVDQEGRTAK